MTVYFKTFMIYFAIIETITNILGSIDKKIEINKKKIEKLEAIARDIYDYWFVQYEFPDENGKPYKSSGGQLVWNDELKREIPVGWTISQLADLCTLRNGINYNSNEVGDKTYKIVNVRDISNSSLFINQFDLDDLCLQQKKANKYLLNNADIIIARSGTPGAIRLLHNNIDTIFCGFIICCTLRNIAHKNYIFYSLKLFEGTNATKTGGSILQNVNQDTLKGIKFALPNIEVINKFDNEIKPIFSTICNINGELHILQQYKKRLLPLLMNGQVKVN